MATRPPLSDAVLYAKLSCMKRYKVGFDGSWQETFESRDEAIEWAKEIADTGRIVDVVQKRLLLPPRLVAVFPESEREAREAARAEPKDYWSTGPF
jgi:hypothetical protein